MKEKIRYDLVPAHGIKEISRVLTRKLDTYEENQWKKGMKWTEVLSSLKKHLNEFEMGNDYTEEGLLNIAEVANNALILFSVSVISCLILNSSLSDFNSSASNFFTANSVSRAASF